MYCFLHLGLLFHVNAQRHGIKTQISISSLFSHVKIYVCLLAVSHRILSVLALLFMRLAFCNLNLGSYAIYSVLGDLTLSLGQHMYKGLEIPMEV